MGFGVARIQMQTPGGWGAEKFRRSVFKEPGQEAIIL